MEDIPLTHPKDFDKKNETLQGKFWDFIKPTYHLQEKLWMRYLFLARDFLLHFTVGIAILAILFLGPLSSYKIIDIALIQQFSLKNFNKYGGGALSILLIFLIISISIFLIGEIIKITAAFCKNQLDIFWTYFKNTLIEPATSSFMKKIETFEGFYKKRTLKAITSYCKKKLQNIENWLIKTKNVNKKNFSTSEYLFFASIKKNNEIKYRIYALLCFIVAMGCIIFEMAKNHPQYLLFLTFSILINILLNILTIDKKNPVPFYIALLTTFFFFTVFFEFITISDIKINLTS